MDVPSGSSVGTATGKPTIVTVAHAAGVSRQTVSNVLRGQGRFSSDVADRVHKAARRLGYQPNLAARQLRTKASNAIGYLLAESSDDIGGSALDRFLHVLARAARARDLRLALYTVDADEDETVEMDSIFTTLQLAGFVVTGTEHGDARTAWLQERGIPFVSFGRPWGLDDPATASHSWVDVDGAVGSELAVRHLIELGHERVAFVGWPAGSGVGDERREGWHRALDAAGMRPGPTIETLDGVEQGIAAYRELAAAPERRRPTAYVCASDSLALGVLQATHIDQRAGAAPVGVVGCDDTTVAHAVGLTSLWHPLQSVATHVLTMLQERIADPASEPRQVMLDPRLVVRVSTTESALLVR